MVPDKFNMVDMEGIDIITSQGEEIPGLYQKLVESIAQCRYQCIYNWKFNGILIPPTYVEMSIIDDVVWINEGVSVDEEDVIRIYSLENEPRLVDISIAANGNYYPPEGYDGFAYVNVSVPEPVLDAILIEQNGNYMPPQGVDGYSLIRVSVPSLLLLNREPTNNDGEQGDYCLSTVQLVPDGIVIRINIAARGGSTNFTYWGTSALRVVFENNQGTEVNITELQNYVVWLSPTGITNNITPQNQLLTNAVGAAYIERNGLPGFIVAKADGLADHKLKSFSICRRQGTSYVDYIANFDVFWLSENDIIGDPIFSASDLTQYDWPNGELVEFEIDSELPTINKLYYKSESGWVQIL